jgi:hypothetical protein
LQIAWMKLHAASIVMEESAVKDHLAVALPIVGRPLGQVLDDDLVGLPP